MSQDTTPTSDARLNLIYNACDVGLNTAMGEGWGLVSLEHAATGAAQAVPRHSACGEIWDGGAVLLEIADRYVPSFSPLEMATVAPAEIGRALGAAYADAAYLRMMSKAAYQTAMRSCYTWDAVARQWADVIHETIDAARATGAQHPPPPPHRARG